MRRWYASVDGGRSGFSVDAETFELARTRAIDMILSPDWQTHPGFFFETRENPTLAQHQARKVVIYTPEEWTTKEHALMLAEGRAVMGDDGKLHLNPERTR